jgi:hypothetical protein
MLARSITAPPVLTIMIDFVVKAVIHLRYERKSVRALTEIGGATCKKELTVIFVPASALILYICLWKFGP